MRLSYCSCDCRKPRSAASRFQCLDNLWCHPPLCGGLVAADEACPRSLNRRLAPGCTSAPRNSKTALLRKVLCAHRSNFVLSQPLVWLRRSVRLLSASSNFQEAVAFVMAIMRFVRLRPAPLLEGRFGSTPLLALPTFRRQVAPAPSSTAWMRSKWTAETCGAVARRRTPPRFGRDFGRTRRHRSS
jgi:hypothetical protein